MVESETDKIIASEVKKLESDQAKRRVIEELNDLKEKINKLNSFIYMSDKFKELSEVKQFLLKKQYLVMYEYAAILDSRLLIW